MSPTTFAVRHKICLFFFFKLMMNANVKHVLLCSSVGKKSPLDVEANSRARGDRRQAVIPAHLHQ